MKYFSIDFLPEKKDTNRKAILISILFGEEKNKLLSKIILVCIFVFLGFFMSQYELIYYAFLSLIIIPKLADIITIFSQINRSNSSQLAKRPVTVDFYADHIVYKFKSTERFRGTFEKHYAFSAVTNVIDSKNSLAFAFGEKDSVIIPKRALSEENGIMINNLIENLFKNKFIKVEI